MPDTYDARDNEIRCYSRKEVIGDATLYLGEISLDEAMRLSRSQRYRLRKRGVLVPEIPARRGYKQTAEHVEKRARLGAAHYAWLGDDVSERGGRTRALRLYQEIGPCTQCGAEKAERHHADENTANNDPSNIAILCRKCHMEQDGRLEAFREMACRKR